MREEDSALAPRHGRTDLDARYGKIGIPAVAAAARYVRYVNDGRDRAEGHVASHSEPHEATG